MLTVQTIARNAKSRSWGKPGGLRLVASTVGIVNGSFIRGMYRSLYRSQPRTAPRWFTKFSFPMLSRVLPALILNDIVSVQPMTAPTSGLFDMVFSDTST